MSEFVSYEVAALRALAEGRPDVAIVYAVLGLADETRNQALSVDDLLTAVMQTRRPSASGVGEKPQ